MGESCWMLQLHTKADTIAGSNPPAALLALLSSLLLHMLLMLPSTNAKALQQLLLAASETQRAAKTANAAGSSYRVRFVLTVGNSCS